MNSKFLALPEEIRARVYNYLFYSRADAPSTAAELEYNARNTPGEAEDYYRVAYELRPLPDHALSLAKTNRQIQDELAEEQRLIYRRGLQYDLDLKLLQNGSVWPTWTVLPFITDRVTELRATFRFFHVLEFVKKPASVRHGLFMGGDGGPPAYIWVLYEVLKNVSSARTTSSHARGWRASWAGSRQACD